MKICKIVSVLLSAALLIGPSLISAQDVEYMMMWPPYSVSDGKIRSDEPAVPMAFRTLQGFASKSECEAQRQELISYWSTSDGQQTYEAIKGDNDSFPMPYETLIARLKAAFCAPDRPRSPVY